MRAPAIAMLVLAILWLMFLTFTTIWDIMLLSRGETVDVECMETWGEFVDDPTDICTVAPEDLATSAWWILADIIIVISAIVTLSRKSVSALYVTSIMSVIPCVSPCICLGIPLGIWGIVVARRVSAEREQESQQVTFAPQGSSDGTRGHPMREQSPYE